MQQTLKGEIVVEEKEMIVSWLVSGENTWIDVCTVQDEMSVGMKEVK